MLVKKSHPHVVHSRIPSNPHATTIFSCQSRQHLVTSIGHGVLWNKVPYNELRSTKIQLITDKNHISVTSCDFLDLLVKMKISKNGKNILIYKISKNSLYLGSPPSQSAKIRPLFLDFFLSITS